MNLLDTIKSQSVKDHIAITRDETLKLIKDIINKNKYKKVLEIGTGYGYSAFCFNECETIIKIVSIEKDPNRAKQAKQFLGDIKKIQVINTSIFDYQYDDVYDFIYIDGPKSHQEEIVKNAYSNLSDGGTIVIDNIFLNKFKNKKDLTSNQIKLLNKLEKFKFWLLNESKLNVKILEIDDGVAILTK